MDKLSAQLQKLVEQACQYPIGSRERQKYLTQIIRLIDDRLWYDNNLYYEDALQQTWLYFCRNLCEGITGKTYNPTRASIITWLNAYLKRRLQDFYHESLKQQTQMISSPDGTPSNSVDILKNKLDMSSLLEEIRQWATLDPQKKLRRIYLTNHPNITCQLLILKRLPPPTPWKELSEELGVSVGTLSSFYQRQCLPCLREFGRSEGYL